MFSSKKPKKTVRAFALISVLVLISILSLFALEFSQRSGINLKMTVNYAQSKKALYYAYGGFQAALSVLKFDDNDYDGPGDFWYGALPPIPFGDGVITVSIDDEKSRFNLQYLITSNELADKRRSVMLGRMFEVLSIESNLVDGIVDWQDGDEEEQPYGAEFSYYLLNSPPYEPRNERILTTGELLVIKGFDRDIFFLPPTSRSPIAREELRPLDQYVTVYGDGKININTADMPVLMSLSEDMDEFIAEDIIEYREENHFEKLDDLKKVESLSDILYDEISSLITVKSNVFRITSTGTSGRLTRKITAVVQRESRGFKVVYYNRSL
jgi:general secretion pathway protein K